MSVFPVAPVSFLTLSFFFFLFVTAAAREALLDAVPVGDYLALMVATMSNADCSDDDSDDEFEFDATAATQACRLTARLMAGA